MERIHEDFAMVTCESVDPSGGRLTVNLERIHKDFARITCDSVDPGGGGFNGKLGKDLQTLCKDYL